MHKRLKNNENWLNLNTKRKIFTIQNYFLHNNIINPFQLLYISCHLNLLTAHIVCYFCLKI